MDLIKLQKFKNFFNKNEFDIKKVIVFNGKYGILAEHRHVTNFKTKKKKVAYYCEGDHYDMGYLIGQLASNEIEIACTNFLSNIIPNYIGYISKSKIIKRIPTFIWNWITRFTINKCFKLKNTIDDRYLLEMNGMIDGCKNINPQTSVSLEKLITLNIGFDYIQNQLYNPESDLLTTSFLGIGFFKNLLIRTTGLIWCNGFTICKDATEEGVMYFGRDFMFPTAGVLQDTFAYIIYNPSNEHEIPHLSLTAPGMFGSIFAFNRKSVSMGVQMSVSLAISKEIRGMNSLSLVRDTISRASTIDEAKEIIIDSYRDISYIYFVADGKTNTSFIAESGKFIDSDNIDSFQYVSDEVINMIPDLDKLKDISGAFGSDSYDSMRDNKGVLFRYDDYVYPSVMFKSNESIFEHFNVPYDNYRFIGDTSFVCNSLADYSIPSSFYFPPLRTRNGVLIATNMSITPYSRLWSMNKWSGFIMGRTQLIDLQWRYDYMNMLIEKNYGMIDEEIAWNIINFLWSIRNYYNYLDKYDGEKIIDGTTTLCNMNSGLVTSRYGYECDLPIKINLLDLDFN